MATMTKPNSFTLLFNALKGMAALIGLLLLLGWSSDYFITRSIISDVYRDFYEYTSDNPVDVLIVGTSHSQLGINTMQLSKKLDASVYNLAMPAQGIGQTYYTLKDALLHTKPQIVLIDAYFADQPEIIKDREYFAYEQLYSMASPDVRLEYISDLVPLENWFNSAFPVINEHEKWKEPMVMKQNFFFNLGTSTEKNRHYNGFVPDTSVMTPETLQAVQALNPKPLAPVPEASREYIRRIVELCRDEGVEPVFVQIPQLPQYLAKVDYKARSLELGTFLKSMNTTWLDGNTAEIDLKPGDFRNESSEIGNNHLNIKGANRYTAMLGSEIKETYGPLLTKGSHKVLTEPRQMMDFLETLKKQDMVFVTVRDDASAGWLPKELEHLSRLNLTRLPVGRHRQAYTAIFTGDGNVLWEWGQVGPIDKVIHMDTVISGVKMPMNVRITSAGPPDAEGHVYLNGQDFSMNSRGLNFVVYDLEQNRVTRVELFDLYDRSLYLKDLME